MSSESGSNTSSKKWSHQFGLYRQAEKTHGSFEKLSEQRQRRLGCICVLASIVVIISVIVALLMIYDYAIVVASTLNHKVKERERIREAKESLPTDLPDEITFDSSEVGTEEHIEKMGSSEKLNRRSLDDDIFRIPQLVNNLQENGFPHSGSGEYGVFLSNGQPKKMKANLKDETSFPQRWRPIYKTPYRPFLFEYKSATPTPFQKAKMYNSWLENYRNSQRLKNIEQVIKYLQKNNSKFTELQAASSNKHLTFSGVYDNTKQSGGEKNEDRFEKLNTRTDRNNSSENKMVNGHAYTFDPLLTYKPDNPGDVNLLANEKSRFSSSQITPQKVKPADNGNLIRSIYQSRKRNCNGHKCSPEHANNNVFNSDDIVEGNKELNGSYSSEAFNGQDTNNSTKTKLLSVMLDIYPMNDNDEQLMKIPDHFTESITRHPMFQFRPRPKKPVSGFGPGSNYYFNSKPKNQSYKPRPSNPPFHNPFNMKSATYGYNKHYGGTTRLLQKPKVVPMHRNNEPTQMLVHLNLFPRQKNNMTPDNGKNTLKEVEVREKKNNVQILKSNTFDYTLNQTENHSFKVSDISHFPTILENARRINELQLLNPKITMFSPSDATPSAVSTEGSDYFRRSTKAEEAQKQIRISTRLKNNYVTTAANVQHNFTSPINAISTIPESSVKDIIPILANNTKNARIYKGINRINQNSQNINNWVSDNIVVTSTEFINVDDFTTNKLAKLYKLIDRSPKTKLLT